MTDYTELKRLAEACKEALPLRYMENHGSLYIRNDHGIVFDVHQNRSFPEFMADNKAYADLALAANPAAVLALIAENERLAQIFASAPEIPSVDEEWLALVQTLEAERDQLKAENEVLRKLAPSKEIIWCACGDGYPVNSHGAGFMDANNGVCANCDAAMGKGEQS